MNRNEETSSLKLNATTASLLAQLAKNWGVSEEEAVRRALEQAHAANGSSNKGGRLTAFKELQQSLELTSAKAAEWQQNVLESRR